MAVFTAAEVQDLRKILSDQLDVSCQFVVKADHASKRADRLQMLLYVKRDMAKRKLCETIQNLESKLQRLKCDVECSIEEKTKEKEKFLSAEKMRMLSLIKEVAELCSHAEDMLQEGHADRLIKEGPRLSVKLRSAMSHPPKPTPEDVSILEFISRDLENHNWTATDMLGYVRSCALTPEQVTVQNCVNRAFVDIEEIITIQCSDGSMANCEYLDVSVQTPEKSNLEVERKYNLDGSVTVSFIPTVQGEHILRISVYGADIQGSPFTIHVCELTSEVSSLDSDGDTESNGLGGDFKARPQRSVLQSVRNHIISNINPLPEAIEEHGNLRRFRKFNKSTPNAAGSKVTFAEPLRSHTKTSAVENVATSPKAHKTHLHNPGRRCELDAGVATACPSKQESSADTRATLTSHRDAHGGGDTRLLYEKGSEQFRVAPQKTLVFQKTRKNSRTTAEDSVGNNDGTSTLDDTNYKRGRQNDARRVGSSKSPSGRREKHAVHNETQITCFPDYNNIKLPSQEIASWSDSAIISAQLDKPPANSGGSKFTDVWPKSDVLVSSQNEADGATTVSVSSNEYRRTSPQEDAHVKVKSGECGQDSGAVSNTSNTGTQNRRQSDDSQHSYTSHTSSSDENNNCKLKASAGHTMKPLVEDGNGTKSIVQQHITANSKGMKAAYVRTIGYCSTHERDKNALSFPLGVTVNNRSDVIVCDSGHNCVKVFEWAGDCKTVIKMGAERCRPSAVVTNQQNDIFVKDDFEVRVYSAQGASIRSFGRSMLKKPYGLVLNDKNNLVLLNADWSNPRVLEFTQTGDLVSKSSYDWLTKADKKSKCRFLDIHNDKLIVADLGLSTIYVSTQSGQKIAQFGEYGHLRGQFNEPSGVTTDVHGNLLIADSKHDRIQIFTPEGVYSGQVELEKPIKRPSGIHLTKDDNLLVSCLLGHCVEVYKLLPPEL